ncbi:SDR family NAD(P)-dependent oxidoreductase [Micromonospora sp. NPDC049559]|uniref:SDR family NAD(P)-dependent oxidoreductase n=1 Tax=Micromonospora sp. NPDC049559 TaxID=3155923 RepID=UPI0034345FB2
MVNPTDRPLAAITGASSGIGYELARQFAEHGYDVVVAAEDAGITDLARALAASGARVEPVQVDLASYDGVERLYQRIRSLNRPLDAVAINAGVGVGGPFARTDLAAELNIVDLNVRSAVHLAKRCVQEMVERGTGGILFTSSIAAAQPGPFEAVYAASKSFLQSFSQALANELKDTGVTVTALMPGVTDTRFFERADMLDTRAGSGRKDDPAEVARQGFEALAKGRDHVVAGSLVNRLLTGASKITPDQVKAQLHRRLSEPGSGQG